jgi:hypothetical protein
MCASRQAINEWNEVIFQSGNLKQLDLEFYLRLRQPTTKRMFRFLDQRFYTAGTSSTSTLEYLHASIYG